MKKVAVSIAALLVLAVVSPAFSQPFADVPTDHWAFDAIAELAAKGLVEGYPDGTFKGDRAMTRYEMAMVVARILARVEAIKIPPPPPPVKIPPPEVTRADIQTLQRLINEFRAELAALGVRVTAVEEELAAVRARLDNTKVTGFAFFRYQAQMTGNGNPYTYGLFNVTFNGKISNTASATVNMLLTTTTGGGVFAFGSGICGALLPGGPATPCADVDTGGYPTPGVSFDRAYIDVAAYGLNWRLGRQTYRLGPIGLLFSEASLNIFAGDSVGADGLKVTGSFGPLSFEAAGFTAGILAGTLNAAYSILMARGSMQIMPGWTLGANFLRENCNQNCAANFLSTGWSVDINGTIIPGLTLTAEYAVFTPGSLFVGPFPDNTAYQVNTVWNLGQLTGMTQFSPTLRIQYKKFGTNYLPFYRGGGDLFGINYTNNYRAWNAQLSLTFSPLFRPYVNYESGSIISTGAGVTELELGFFSQITSGVTARFRYQRREQPAGTVLTHRYRLQIDASW
ncbi:MAG TPA: S-layer homology domain-containing protein [bacterium]